MYKTNATGPFFRSSVGRVHATCTYDPTVLEDSLKLLATENKYDVGGKLLKNVKYPYGLSQKGLDRRVVENYEYDRLGRISSVQVRNGVHPYQTELVRYEYYPTGSVKRAVLGNSIALDYTYHISGAVKTAVATRVSDGSMIYADTLSYEDCAEGDADCEPQYNGNISRLAHEIAVNGKSHRVSDYAYDFMNRLTAAIDPEKKTEWDEFNEYFTYDDQGRITSQRRGVGRGGVSETGGEYGYYAGTNKLEKVANGMGGKSAEKRKMDDAGNFVYDSEGNLIEDKSKKMKISYDWRGMPVEFVRQDVCENGKCASTRLTLDYDGSGRRISKTVWRKAAGESGWTKDNITHYTGIGTEVRENFAGSTPGAKVVVSLPEGLGRYAPGDASENADAKPLKDENGNELAGMLPGTNFEWYLKNHLGSTMLVFGTQSSASPDVADNGTLKAAYDYHAFGEQLTLVEPTDKVTENFTGKGERGECCDSRVYSNWHCRAEEHCAQRNEKDDEIELNYFGARYLDPMLGLWVSVDPARQFASPYLYAGNGMNPVNVVDGDGKFVISQFENTFRYHYHSSLSILFLEGTKYIPVLGPLISAFLPTGEVVNSHRSKWYEGLTSAVADFVGFGLSKNLASFLGKNPPLLSSFIDDAFYITQEMNIINNFIFQ